MMEKIKYKVIKRHEPPLQIWGREDGIVRRYAGSIERRDEPRHDLGAFEARDDRVSIWAATRAVVAHDAARGGQPGLNDCCRSSLEIAAQACPVASVQRYWAEQRRRRRSELATSIVRSTTDSLMVSRTTTV